MCLRIGILVNATTIPAWIGKILAVTQACDYATLSRIVITPVVPPFTWREFPQRVAMWERMLLGGREGLPADASAEVLLMDCAKDIPVILLPHQDARYDPTVIQAIETAHLDVLLDFRQSYPDFGLVGSARYGIWPCLPVACHDISFRFGNRPTANDGVPILIQAFTQDVPDGITVGHSVAFHQLGWSFAHSDVICWKAADLILQAIRRVAMGDWPEMVRRKASNQAARFGRPSLEIQNVRDASFYLLRQMAKNLRRGFVTDHWQVALRPRLEGPPQRDPRLDTFGFTIIGQEKGSFLADPFVIEHDGQTYLFFEYFIAARGKAVIACTALDAQGKPGDIRTVLERPYHLSFPMLFRWANEIYMIPETSANRSVELYRAEKFPEQWVLDRVMLHDLDASDTTVFFKQGVWWLFTTVKHDSAQTYDDLHAYYSSSLKGPWHPHLMNPIVTDARSGRSAGHLFWAGEKLIRPAQDGAVTYGGAINFYQVHELTPRSYREAPLWRLAPDAASGYAGIHTYNFSGHFEVIDIKKLRFHFPGQRFKSLLKGLTGHRSHRRLQ